MLKKVKPILLFIFIAMIFISTKNHHVLATAGGFHGGGGHGGGFHSSGHYSGNSSGRNSLWDFIWLPILILGYIFDKIFGKATGKYQRGNTISNRELSTKIKSNFLEIQKAWDRENLFPVQNLYEDKLYHKHTMILEEYSKKGQVNHTREVNVVGLNRYKKMGFSKFSVDISFMAVDFVLDKGTNKVIKGGRNNRRFLQRWTFTDDGYDIKACKIKELKI